MDGAPGEATCISQLVSWGQTPWLWVNWYRTTTVLVFVKYQEVILNCFSRFHRILTHYTDHCFDNVLDICNALILGIRSMSLKKLLSFNVIGGNEVT